MTRAEARVRCVACQRKPVGDKRVRNGHERDNVAVVGFATNILRGLRMEWRKILRLTVKTLESGDLDHPGPNVLICIGM